MSAKRKPQHPQHPQQPKVLRNEVQALTSIPEETKKLVKDEVYIPSENADKYPSVNKIPEMQYKVLAFRNDYIKLQEEVTKHLNQGWQLAGGLSTCMNVSQYESVTIFTQAVIKSK